MDGVERHNKDVPQEIELAQQSSNLSHASDNVDKKKQAVEALERDLKSRFDHLTFWQTVKVFRKASHHAVFACTMMCIAAACEGYQVNLNGNIIANLGFVRNVGFQNDQGDWQLNANHTALWGALQSFGQMVGMLGLNPISDRIGRKWTLYVVWVILAANTIIEMLTRNFQDWAGAKFLAGVGVGAIQATLPIYITEWSPVNIRGAMTIAYGIWNNIGNFLAPVVLMISERQDAYNWKTPVLTQWAFLGLMLPIFIWLPETAYYYAAKDQDDLGRKTLRRVNGSVPGYDVEGEYAIIKNIILEERAIRSELGVETNNWKDLIHSYVACFRGTNLKRTIAAALPASLGQLTGLSFLNIYSSSGLRIFAVVILTFAVDPFGRRNICLAGGAWCCLMLLLVGVLGQVPRSSAVDNALIAVVCLWSPINTCLNSIGWTFVGEVAAQTVRARTAGIAAAGGVIFGLTFNTSVPIMLDVDGADLGYNTGFLFFGFGIIALAVCVFLLPETARRNPAELDEMYTKKIAPWRMSKYVTDVQKRENARRAGNGTVADAPQA